MLVVAPDFDLTEAADGEVPAGTPMILWDNVAIYGSVVSRIRFSDDSPVFNSSADGFPATNLTNPATNLEWRGEEISNYELIWFNNDNDTVEAVGIAQHNFGSAGIAVNVGYYTGPNPSDPFVSIIGGPFMPNNDEPLLIVIRQDNPGNLVVRLHEGSDIPRAAVMYVGDLLVMERSLDINPDFAIPRFGKRSEFIVGRAESGDYLGRVVTSRFIDKIEHTYKHITPDWYRSHFDPFIRASQQDVPFFYCVQPDRPPYEVAYVWFTEDPIGLTNPVTRRKGVVMRMAMV